MIYDLRIIDVIRQKVSFFDLHKAITSTIFSRERHYYHRYCGLIDSN
jgi:hypothetical protein